MSLSDRVEALARRVGVETKSVRQEVSRYGVRPPTGWVQRPGGYLGTAQTTQSSGRLGLFRTVRLAAHRADAIGVQVTTAAANGGTALVGLWSDVNGLPGRLLAQGTVTVANTGSHLADITPTDLPGEHIWTGFLWSGAGTGPALHCVNSNTLDLAAPQGFAWSTSVRGLQRTGLSALPSNDFTPGNVGITGNPDVPVVVWRGA